MTKRAKRMLLIIGSVIACVILAFVVFVASVLNSFDFTEKYPHRPDALT